MDDPESDTNENATNDGARKAKSNVCTEHGHNPSWNVERSDRAALEGKGKESKMQVGGALPIGKDESVDHDEENAAKDNRPGVPSSDE